MYYFCNSDTKSSWCHQVFCNNEMLLKSLQPVQGRELVLWLPWSASECGTTFSIQLTNIHWPWFSSLPAASGHNLWDFHTKNATLFPLVWPAETSIVAHSHFHTWRLKIPICLISNGKERLSPPCRWSCCHHLPQSLAALKDHSINVSRSKNK